MKGIKFDFCWNRKYYGHKNGRFFKSDNENFAGATEITPTEHTEMAEKYARVILGRNL